MLCLPCYAYVFSSTKIEIRAEQAVPGSEMGRGGEDGMGRGVGGRNDPSNVCTCE
jgi:hypothetical protein